MSKEEKEELMSKSIIFLNHVILEPKTKSIETHESPKIQSKEPGIIQEIQSIFEQFGKKLMDKYKIIFEKSKQI